MPRYVILQHETADDLHFDFMLEAGGTLKTWSLPEPPRPGAEIDCRALADHRLVYLDYEGPVAGNRGAVARWDCGVYETRRQTDAQWVVAIVGRRFSGEATLSRSSNDPRQWRILFAAEEKQDG